jgi:hypothetical protein
MKKPEVIQAFGTKKQRATQLKQQILPTGFQAPSMPGSFTSGPLKGWLIQLTFKLDNFQVNKNFRLLTFQSTNIAVN